MWRNNIEPLELRPDMANPFEGRGSSFSDRRERGPEELHCDTAPRIFIDALNLAYWCGPPAGLRIPATALIALLSRGRRATLYFDASAPYRIPTEIELYRRFLQRADRCVEVPAGRPADRMILRLATTARGCVLSRDRYRDHRRRYRRLIDDADRLVSGYIQNDRLQVPGLGLDVPLIDAVEALDLLESLEPISCSEHKADP